MRKVFLYWGIICLILALSGCSLGNMNNSGQEGNEEINDSIIDYGKVWEQIIAGEGKSFVCFSHGTSVIFTESQPDLEQAAIKLLQEWGPVHAGSSAGDFSIINLRNHSGWVVTSHHNDILTYVDPLEGEFDEESDLEIGLYGRGKRNDDASDLKIIHVHKSP